MLSSKGRVKILRILADIGELNISEIARRAGLNFTTTNKHLKVLEDHQLVKHKRFGRIRIFRYNEESSRARMMKQLVELWDK